MATTHDVERIPLLHKLQNYGQDGTKKGIRGREIGELVKGYANLLELIPDLDTPAIAEPLNTERIPLTHRRLRQFIAKEFDLFQFNLPVGCRVATLLPNGPELAVTMLSVVSRWCAAPINPTNSWQEIKAELESTKSQAIIILAGASANEAALEAAESLKIGVIVITSTGSISGLFTMALLHRVPPRLQGVQVGYTVAETTPGFTAYSHPETVLLLHTSGTSGNKKLVPYSLDMVITGVGCIVSSWGLSPKDVCLNMMPLFHIGGIMRNVLSPVLSGGCVITCSGFDPLLFWDILSAPSACYGNATEITIQESFSTEGHRDLYRAHSFQLDGETKCESEKDRGRGARRPHALKVTWYYAAPTMHHAILLEAEQRSFTTKDDGIDAWNSKDVVGPMRFIANAAGGLLPVLAEALQSTFQATILTSYGMTECMPISSPPQTYLLDPTGTSGMAVGPDICIVDDDLQVVSTGVKGNILVRGPPCFGGYENNGSANEESFFTIDGEPGWFNTGDMGSLDKNGYIFISGRSKEIINRGGETISPFEIEEAVQQYPSVKEVLAFSAPHEQYQETVGCVIVTHTGQARVDLPTLHKYLEDKLHRSKWPFVIVYSDALPKNAANKILRIRYAERTKMRSIDEDSSPLSRLYEAKCPAVGAPLTEPIVATLVVDHPSFNSEGTENLLKTAVVTLSGGKTARVVSACVVRVDLPFKPDSYVAFIQLKRERLVAEDLDTNSSSTWMSEAQQLLLSECEKSLHRYLVPVFITATSVLPLSTNPEDPEGTIDRQFLKKQALTIYAENSVVKPRNAMETQIEAVWRTQLGATSTVSVVASFFDLGGDSLKAGQLINAMRKKLRVQLAVADLFTAPTIEALATKISLLQTLGSPHANDATAAEKRKSRRDPLKTSPISPTSIGDSADIANLSSYETSSPFSNRSWGCLIIQSMPLLIVFPLRRIVIWFLVAYVWVFMMAKGVGRFHALVIAMLLSRLALGILAPLAGITVKWVVIGRYKAGRYPLWGSMYLRWWLVEQIVNIFGKGFFKDDFPIFGCHLVRLYYVLMGARIGSNVKIHRDAKLGQADLLTIGNDVVIDVATLRPFTIEEGYFLLLPITIGDRCSIGLKSQVAAGSTLSSGTHLGPLSSSHELDDAEAHYRHYCRPSFQPPPSYLILLVGCPVLLSVLAVGLVPWYFALLFMVQTATLGGWYVLHIHTVFQAFLWWITPERLVFYFLLRIVRRCFVPFMRLALVIIIKRTIIGEFKPLDAAGKSRPWNRFRYWLMSKLLPGGGLAGVARLVGSHYEIISVIYRLLGADIGKRVYWPGSGLDIVEYDLLKVGDDVVFGSRSVVLTSTAVRSAKVVFESGAMVADRCVVLPGVVLKKGSVLGSGSLAPEDFKMDVGSVWVGSRNGSAVPVAPADLSYNVKDTISPFGRAFYKGQASYWVIPLWLIVFYNTCWQAISTCYRNSPTALSLILASAIMKFEEYEYSTGELFKIIFITFVPLHLWLCLLALSVDIVSKWGLMGKRKQGAFPWDQSDYCQKWQVYLTLEEIRRGERRRTGVLDMLQGSQYLVWYFKCLGAKIGENVCLYPNGGDPMMTEPDLVTIGDDSSIDDASLIAHINTRGIFRLNPLTVGKGCVLKSGTRLLSGASMDDHSVMLEHTLVLAGEVVDSGMVWQGWPCTRQIPLTTHRRNVRGQLDALMLQRMTKRERSKREESMAVAACCWPCRKIGCCPRNEYDSVSAVEDSIAAAISETERDRVRKRERDYIPARSPPHHSAQTMAFSRPSSVIRTPAQQGADNEYQYNLRNNTLAVYSNKDGIVMSSIAVAVQPSQGTPLLDNNKAANGSNNGRSYGADK